MHGSIVEFLSNKEENSAWISYIVLIPIETQSQHRKVFLKGED